MTSEITVEVTGDDPVENIQAVLGNLGIDEDTLTRVAVTMEVGDAPSAADNGPELEGPGEDGQGPEDDRTTRDTTVEPQERIRPETNQHVALSMLATYLERTGEKTATRDDVATVDENPLSVQQTGNALSLIHRGKGLIDADKLEREDGGGHINAYSLTPEGRAELERIGRYNEV